MTDPELWFDQDEWYDDISSDRRSGFTNSSVRSNILPEIKQGLKKLTPTENIMKPFFFGDSKASTPTVEFGVEKLFTLRENSVKKKTNHTEGKTILNNSDVSLKSSLTNKPKRPNYLFEPSSSNISEPNL